MDKVLSTYLSIIAHPTAILKGDSMQWRELKENNSAFTDIHVKYARIYMLYRKSIFERTRSNNYTCNIYIYLRE